MSRLCHARKKPVLFTSSRESGRGSEETDRLREVGAEEGLCPAITEYATIFAISNICIAGWLLFWLKEHFTASQVVVIISTASHLFAVGRLPPVTANSPRLLYLTHYVAKSIAGLGILLFVDNTAIATYYHTPPSKDVQALTYILFPFAAAISSPFLGSTLTFDLLALWVGQRSVSGAELWDHRLGWTTTAVAAVVSVKSCIT